MLTITDKGITTETLPEIQGRLESRFREIYGQDINLDPSTPDGQWLGVISQELANCNEVISGIVRMLNPYTSTGRWLTDRALYAGLVRKGAQYSRVDSLIVTGSKGVVLPSGMVMRDSSGNKWVTERQYKLNDLGSAEISARSQELGIFELSTGDTLDTESLIVGIDKITVSKKSVNGNEEETDGELLIRFMKSHAINNEDDRAGIQAAVSALPDVKECVVYENFTGATDEKGVPPHSVNVVVVGGDSKDIAKTIIRKKKGGCGMMGDVYESVMVSDLQRTARFDRAEEKKITVKVTVKRIQPGIDYQEETTKTAIAGNKFTIGHDVYATNLYCSIPNQNGFVVTGITVNNAQSVSVGYREIAVIKPEDINVDMAV